MYSTNANIAWVKSQYRLTEDRQSIAVDKTVWADVKDRLKSEGVQIDFNPTLHPQDIMFLYSLYNHPAHPKQALFSYFYEGYSIAKNLFNLVQERSLPHNNILDFGSGYGRVSRFLPHLFPNANLFASEVKTSSLRFLQDQFGLQPLGQNAYVSAGAWPSQDIVLALSVFTHLPKELFTSWLRQLFDLLSPGGALVFTFKDMAINRKHLGRVKRFFRSRHFVFLKSSEDVLFPFLEEANQKVEEYGVSFVSRHFLTQQANSLGARLVFVNYALTQGQEAAILIKPKDADSK